MRLIVARCAVEYTGRLSTRLPEAVRLLMLKADGTFMIWADGGGSSVKPLNWMTPPTVIEESGGLIVVRKRMGASEDRLEISISEVLSDVTHEMGSPDAAGGLEKDGVEAHLQELLAECPEWCGEGFRLVRREWPTDIGPVDLMCRDAEEEWVAVEVKRVAGIEAVDRSTGTSSASRPAAASAATRAGRPSRSRRPRPSRSPPPSQRLSGGVLRCRIGR